jgi:hypothetical protein
LLLGHALENDETHGLSIFNVKVILIEEKDAEKEWHTLSGSSRAPFYM